VETAEAGGELLSTVHMQSEQWWRMQKTKEKGKGKRKSSGWRWRPVVKGSCSPLLRPDRVQFKAKCIELGSTPVKKKFNFYFF
jgi:hypothetical protein